jgi:hypothetical protein
MNNHVLQLKAKRSTIQRPLAPTLLLFAAIVFSGCGGKTDSSGTMSSDGATDASMATAANTLSKAEMDAGWKLLFDGKTTTGWKGYNRDTFPTKGWRVENGMLIVEASNTEEAGFGGDIVTTESFDNFDFSVDFMLTDTSNSGILYRVVENEDPIWYNAPEYQLLDDETYISRDGIESTVHHLTGDNYDIQSSSVKASNPIGEWNTARIVVDGAHVEHWLNGQKTLEYELWSPEWEALVKKSKFAEYPAYGRTQRGPIGLQDHGHRVSFRNIKIRSLSHN